MPSARRWLLWSLEIEMKNSLINAKAIVQLQIEWTRRWHKAPTPLKLYPQMRGAAGTAR